ncbi:hypothetical protein EBR37_00760 [bacterium]|nr:hypothetical protein [bacterium]
MNPDPYKTTSNSNYDFILNPQKPKKAFNIGGNSMQKKILAILSILIFLIVGFTIFKNLTTTKVLSISDLTNVVIEQQKIINLVKNDFISSNSTNQFSQAQINAIATINLTIPSEQKSLINYLKDSSYVIKSSTIGSVKTTSLDTQINNAAAAGNLTSTYNSIMKSELNNYLNYLSIGYNTTKGPKGKALLKQEYQNANTLLKQLN